VMTAIATLVLMPPDNICRARPRSGCGCVGGRWKCAGNRAAGIPVPIGAYRLGKVATWRQRKG
jgi:hypothetical protein